MPMELGKVQVAGICQVCKKLWPCLDHPPCLHHQICGVIFNGQEISGEMFGALCTMMDNAKKEVPQFAQDVVNNLGFQSVQ